MQYTAIFTMRDIAASEHTKVSEFMYGQLCRPFGQLWYCPICSDIWIKVSIRDTHNIYSSYTAVRNECKNCTQNDELLYKTRITLPGSILMEGYNTIEELSDEMLKRELLLELNAVKYLIDKGVL